MLAALTDDRVVLTSEQLQNYKKNLPDILRNAVKLSESSHRQTELKQQLQQLQDTITKVTPFKEIDLELFGDFQYVRFIPFYVNAQRRDFVVANIEQLFPMLSLESIDKVGEEYVYVAAVLKDQVDEVMNYLTDHTTLITIQTTVSGSFKDVYRESVHTFENISQQIAVIEQEIQEAARQSMDFLVARDILKSDLEKVFFLACFCCQRSPDNSESIGCSGEY
jgi:conjugal transfer/entry exclusion protein